MNARIKLSGGLRKGRAARSLIRVGLCRGRISRSACIGAGWRGNRLPRQVMHRSRRGGIYSRKVCDVRAIQGALP